MGGLLQLVHLDEWTSNQLSVTLH